jgi:hypothetical protein
MEGSINGNDFKDFINGFVRDHNKKNSGITPNINYLSHLQTIAITQNRLAVLYRKATWISN